MLERQIPQACLDVHSDTHVGSLYTLYLPPCICRHSITRVDVTFLGSCLGGSNGSTPATNFDGAFD